MLNKQKDFFEDVKYVALPFLPINLFGLYEVITNLDKLQFVSIFIILGTTCGSGLGIYFIYKIIKRRFRHGVEQ